MKTEFWRILRRAALPAVVVSPLLAGCGANHVGEDWQCPMVQGSRCASVEAADPAIPPAARSDAPATERPAAFGPGAEAAAVAAAGAAERAGCASCRSRRGLSGRFRRAGGESRGREAAGAGVSGSAANAVPAADASASAPAFPRSAEIAVENPAAAVRVPEKIGRVWIAPWADAGGAYREGAWMRVVISPAAWRRF